MALVLLLHHNFYYFSCDRRFELQNRIVNVVDWLCCQIFLNSIFVDRCARFNLITNLFEDRDKAKSSWIHTMVKSFMTLRFPALILSFTLLSSVTAFNFFFWVRQLHEGSPLSYNFVAIGMNQIFRQKIAMISNIFQRYLSSAIVTIKADCGLILAFFEPVLVLAVKFPQVCI